MFGKDGYWIFKNAVDKKFCDSVHKIVKSVKPIKGITADFKDSKISKKELKEIRDSDVKFISKQFIYDKINPFVQTANTQAKWNYEYDYCEAAQYTIYGKNQHYGWHTDQSDEPYQSDDINFNGKTRKLSCTLLLNNSNEYEGGDFEFDFRNFKTGSNIKKANELENQGDLIIFPSFMWHRVTPVTKGVRKSLVVWYIEPPFK